MPDRHAENEERVKAAIRRAVRQLHGAAHDTGKHSHAISLITSDREGAEGNGHGHFHCSAPLATCPVHAFSKHMNTRTHKERVSERTHSHNSSFPKTDQNRQLDAEVHTQTNKQTTEGRTMK